MTTKSESVMPNREVLSALREAGYDFSDEQDLLVGLAAFETADQLYRYRLSGVGAVSADQGAKVGRNQPCPCGSGKKYRKCCVGKEPIETKPLPLSPRREPGLIPCLSDIERLTEDVARVSELLQTDPSLKEIRFDGSRAVEFLAHQLPSLSPAELTDSSSDADEQLVDDDEYDEVVQRYFTEVEKGRLPPQLFSAVKEAASRTSDTDQLRSLALVMLWLATSEDIHSGPNPLVDLLFKATLDEYYEGYQAIGNLIEQFGGEEAIAKARDDLDEEQVEQFMNQLGDLDPSIQRLINRTVDGLAEKLDASIQDGDFPVYLSLASLLPVLAELKQLPPDEVSAQAFESIFTSTAALLVDEDAVLYETLLRQWLESDDQGNDPRITSMVHTMADIIAAGALESYGPMLLVAGIKHGLTSYLPGEEEIAGNWPSNRDFLDSASLEPYAQFLEGHGYPALAQRTRKLAAALAGQSKPGSSSAPSFSAS
jgi:hypothetical protein